MVDLNIWPFNERFVIADALTNLIKQKFPELDSYCRRMEAHPAIKPIVTSKEILREFAKGYQVGTFKYDDLWLQGESMRDIRQGKDTGTAKL